MFIKKKLAFKSFWWAEGRGSRTWRFIVLLYKSGNDTVTNCNLNQLNPTFKSFFYE